MVASSSFRAFLCVWEEIVLAIVWSISVIGLSSCGSLPYKSASSSSNVSKVCVPIVVVIGSLLRSSSTLLWWFSNAFLISSLIFSLSTKSSSSSSLTISTKTSCPSLIENAPFASSPLTFFSKKASHKSTSPFNPPVKSNSLILLFVSSSLIRKAFLATSCISPIVSFADAYMIALRTFASFDGGGAAEDDDVNGFNRAKNPCCCCCCSTLLSLLL